MKKIILVIGLVLAMLLTACTPVNKNENKNESVNDNKVSDDKKIVASSTSFINDMVKVLAGDFVQRELIIPAGEDPHVYVAKPEDLNKIKNANLVLYHGLHFEGKMIEMLEKVGQNITSEFSGEDTTIMEDDGETVLDPHFWFDLNLYKKAITKVAEHLEKLVPEKSKEIKENLNVYMTKLDELDKENRELLDQIPKESRYLVTPHDAFNYFSRYYNIEVVAPQGVSTQSEVANKDLEDTASLIAEKKIKAIFAETTTDPQRMEKLKEIVRSKGSDVKVVSGHGNELFSDSLAPEGEKGDSFIDMYRHNVKLISDNLK
ncbi:metal ABC transporter solute-binding protein, Zn/Mn family [Microaceticoccus formicicus]|uniref:metal ABC transporter solute-binding protein, Zn/Mn family n=1 Tax=Microaceticoccus formicicus TaxID=3118105 RepID=UPI003CD040DF|nr:zinc ABC transporter substrate-binding protein [Peptoniphilaceae bacterium AMB_02]